MSKFQNQLQNDITGAANGMITQMICAERGINYDAVMQAAQQQHMQQILQSEQQRQMGALVKRHYQGESFFGKIANVLGAPESNLLMPVPAPNFGQQQLAQPVYVQQPQMVQQPQFAQNPMHAAQMIQQQAVPQFQPQPVVDPQVADLQNQMNDIKSLLSNLINPAPTQYQGVPEYTPQQPPVRPGTNDAPHQYNPVQESI